jgi:hypothetical protein
MAFLWAALAQELPAMQAGEVVVVLAVRRGRRIIPVVQMVHKVSMFQGCSQP